MVSPATVEAVAGNQWRYALVAVQAGEEEESPIICTVSVTCKPVDRAIVILVHLVSVRQMAAACARRRPLPQSLVVGAGSAGSLVVSFNAMLQTRRLSVLSVAPSDGGNLRPCARSTRLLLHGPFLLFSPGGRPLRREGAIRQ